VELLHRWRARARGRGRGVVGGRVARRTPRTVGVATWASAPGLRSARAEGASVERGAGERVSVTSALLPRALPVIFMTYLTVLAICPPRACADGRRAALRAGAPAAAGRGAVAELAAAAAAAALGLPSCADRAGRPSTGAVRCGDGRGVE